MLELERSGNSRAAEMAKEQGCIAIWGKGATGPRGWKDVSCVHPTLSGVIMVRPAVLPPTPATLDVF